MHTQGCASHPMANTEILVGVKAELEEPKPDQPGAGRLEFFVDCSANATPEFQGGGGEELATAITNLLYRAYSSSTVLDTKSLCLLPGKFCWVLYVDVVLLECGGNLFDAASVAVKAAIFNTKIPSVAVRKEEGGSSKIDHNHAVDASQKEEACCLARLMMAVTQSGSVAAMVKEGQGSLDPDSVTEMMQVGQKVGKQVNQKLLQTLKEEEQKGLKRKTVGFLR
ncbi:hypothetical protein ACOMHN_027177 [Nucella lapillus]